MGTLRLFERRIPQSTRPSLASRLTSADGVKEMERDALPHPESAPEPSDVERARRVLGGVPRLDRTGAAVSARSIRRVRELSVLARHVVQPDALGGDARVTLSTTARTGLLRGDRLRVRRVFTEANRRHSRVDQP